MGRRDEPEVKPADKKTPPDGGVFCPRKGKEHQWHGHGADLVMYGGDRAAELPRYRPHPPN